MTKIKDRISSLYKGLKEMPYSIKWGQAVKLPSMKPVVKASGAEKYFEKEINLSLKNDTFLRTEKKLKKDN